MLNLVSTHRWSNFISPILRRFGNIAFTKKVELIRHRKLEKPKFAS